MRDVKVVAHYLFLTVVCTISVFGQANPRVVIVPDWIDVKKKTPVIFNDGSVPAHTPYDPTIPEMKDNYLRPKTYTWLNGDEIDAATVSKMREKVIPDPYDVTSNKVFLSQARTGIFKLLPSRDCIWGVYLVFKSEKCADFAVESSAFSFRSSVNVEIESFDIRLGKEDDLRLNGFANNALITSVNVRSIGDVSLERPELQYIREFKPADDFLGFKSQVKKLDRAEYVNGFFYSRAVRARVGSIYAARVIAYDLDLPQNTKATSHLGALFGAKDRFRKGDRVDITVAFSVIRKSSDGGVTILWKELSRKPSPELRVTSKMKFEDIFF